MITPGFSQVLSLIFKSDNICSMEKRLKKRSPSSDARQENTVTSRSFHVTFARVSAKGNGMETEVRKLSCRH